MGGFFFCFSLHARVFLKCERKVDFVTLFIFTNIYFKDFSLHHKCLKCWFFEVVSCWMSLYIFSKHDVRSFLWFMLSQGNQFFSVIVIMLTHKIIFFREIIILYIRYITYVSWKNIIFILILWIKLNGESRFDGNVYSMYDTYI